MRRGRRVLSVLALLLAGAATAQPAPPMTVQPATGGGSSVGQPVGIKLGDGRLHPFLDVETRYDSLVGYFERNASGAYIPSGELILHFRPGLRFELTTTSTQVGLNAAAEYLWYTGLLSPSSTSLSEWPRGLRANVGLDTAFNRDGAVEVQIGDTLIRSDRTQNPAVTVGLMSLFNDARLAVPIHPGGRALEIIPKVSWQVELFERLLTGTVPWCTNATDPTCNPEAMNYSNLNFALSNRWKFLPKTAVMLDASFNYRTYLSSPATNRPALLLNVQTGLVGLVSPRISVTLLAGYTGEFANSVHNFIANAEVSYIPSDLAKVSLGYLRTMQPVPVYGTFGDDRGYLSARLGLMQGRLNLTAQVNADYFTFYGGSNRHDFLLSASAGPTFDVASWFQTGLGYTLTTRSSWGTSASYLRHEVLLRLTLRY